MSTIDTVTGWSRRHLLNRPDPEPWTRRVSLPDPAPRVLRYAGVVGAVVAGAYAAVASGVALWGSLTLTRIERYKFVPSARVRRAILKLPDSPTTGDEPLWHPAVALAGGDPADGVVELAGPTVDARGLWGLEWEGGYAQLGEVLDRRDDDRAPGGRIVRREIRVLQGTLSADAAPAPGAVVAPDDVADTDGSADGVDAALCAYVWPDELDVLARELSRMGVDAQVSEVGIASTAGLFPATLVVPPAEQRARAGDTWVVAVHGRGSRPAQIYRMVPTMTARGFTTLAITYRGDSDTPSAGWRSTLGTVEWHEVESAVSYALTRGARRVVLYGFSMGGAIVTAFLRRSPLAGAVTGLVLDAPVLDWGPVLRYVAERMRLPRSIVPLTMLAIRLLVGADFDLVNRLLPPRRPSDGGGRRPTLLIHGTDDPLVPVCSSDMLAEAEPSAVRYLRVPNAGHTTAYNYAPARYEAHLSDFLTTVVDGPPAPETLLPVDLRAST